MKIPLNMGQSGGVPGVENYQALERDILAAKNGDWAAKSNLVRRYTPLLNSLAQKRTADAAQQARLIEAGKNGLYKAARKYKKTIQPEKFQIFALDFIEKAMDKASGGGGFLSRLFGG